MKDNVKKGLEVAGCAVVGGAIGWCVGTGITKLIDKRAEKKAKQQKTDK